MLIRSPGKFLTGLILAGFTYFSFPVLATAAPDKWAQGRILVKPQAGISQSEFKATVNAHGGRSIETIQGLGIHIISVPPHAEDIVVQALSHDKRIEYAQKDYLFDIAETIANDSHYNDAWHLATIKAPTAWDDSLGGGITIAVLDTGIDSGHSDLQGKLLPGWNIKDGNSNTSDVHGHGTMVAGVAAAASNNNKGVTSVAWNAMILPIRVSETNGTAFVSKIAKGIDWAADNGADVVNISYAVSSQFAVKTAAEKFRNLGGVICVAAGNSGDQISTAPDPYVLTVSATNSNDAMAGWSSYGDVVDLAAPGTSIWTTLKGGGYGTVNGTSFSSPMTAGVVALIMSANPGLAPAEIEAVLMETSHDLGTPGQDIYFGHGRIDAAAAVAAALGGSNNPPPADTEDPTVGISSPTGGTVSASVIVSISAGDNTGVSQVILKVGNTLIGTDSSAPYNISWDTTGTPDGTVQLVAYAYDAAGNEGTSQAVSVTVDNPAPVADTEPPQVNILNPAGTITVDGKVKITIAAADNIGVTRVECHIDGILKATTTGATLDYTWNTRKVSSGIHTITGKACDAAGNCSTTDIQVTIGDSGGDTGGDTGGTGSKGWGKGGKNK